MGRIYAILTDALGKPVYSEIYPEKTATTVSVWIIGFLLDRLVFALGHHGVEFDSEKFPVATGGDITNLSGLCL